MCACQQLINTVVHQRATELHADATFKGVPSIPYCRQLLINHLILQNHSLQKNIKKMGYPGHIKQNSKEKMH